MLGFELFAAIVVVGPLSTSASEISAEPCFIPVAQFLATGLYGNKCDTALSKLFCKPFRPLSILTLAIAACSQHWHIELHRLENQRDSVHWATGIEGVLHRLTLIHMRCNVGR